MAVVLDINLLSNNFLDINIISQMIDEHNANILSINSIDNWMWDNEKEIGSLTQIENILNSYCIIIIQLKHPLFKDLGIYIEKIDATYFYTIWINTEGYPVLDCDNISSSNYKYYEKIVQIILKMNKNVHNFFEVIAIGLETEFYYSKNIIDIIKNSKNIIIWILNDQVKLNSQLGDYKVKNIEGMLILKNSTVR